MTFNKDNLKDKYLNWLKEKIQYEALENEIIEITTPFLDRNNDYLQIYAELDKNEQIRLSDDGVVISELEMVGVNVFSSDKRKELFNLIIKGFGISFDADSKELFVCTNAKDFARKKHMLIQAMLSVSDLFFTSKVNIRSMFLEDVDNFFEQNNIRATSNIQFQGKSGFSQAFHFVIPGYRETPERIIQAVNNPDKTHSTRIIFNWEDVKSNRKENSKLIVIMNDSEKKASTEIIESFKNYDIIPVQWSERCNILEALQA